MLHKQNQRDRCIKTDTTILEWNKLNQPGTYETELADTVIIAVARSIHKDIQVFNTNNTLSNSTIYVIDAEEYQGGIGYNSNSIILAYNGSHYESLDS